MRRFTAVSRNSLVRGAIQIAGKGGVKHPEDSVHSDQLGPRNEATDIKVRLGPGSIWHRVLLGMSRAERPDTTKTAMESQTL